MSSSGEAYIDRRLLEAATTGDVPSMKQLLAVNGPGVLLGTTPQGNTCLHIASIQGHEEFCKNILTLELDHSRALLSAVNQDGETPLLTAVARGRASLASVLLRCCRDNNHLRETILKQDRRGFNALHHAIRRGYTMLALELIEAEPALSKAVNQYSESPLFIAMTRNFIEVFDKLLEIPDSANSGVSGFNVLHAAVRNGNPAIVKRIMETRPWQARQENEDKYTPIHLAAYEDKIDAITVADNASSDSSSEVETTAFTSLSEGTRMDERVLEAAVSGHARLMNDLVSQDPSVLLGTTPQGNTCLHVASIHGHQGFCNDVLMLNQSLPLLNAINADGETPLLTAVARGRATLCSVLLRFCRDQQLRETILKQDKHGFNALHHAILRGHRKLALELIEAEPALSKAVTKCCESPMFIAVMRGYGDVLEKLLKILDSAHDGADGYNALHAAVTSGNAVMAKSIMVARPGLVKQENEDKCTPMHLAAKENRIDMLQLLLEHDPSLGYFISTDGSPLLCIAATEGNVGIARELLRHCPDPPYCDTTRSTCLHIAVSSGQEDFVRFVLRSPQLLHLIDMPNDRGETALQLAARKVPDDGGESETATTNQDMVDVLQFHLNNLRIHEESFTPGMGRLLEAAASGHVAEMRNLSLVDSGVLSETTPERNTCLHIAATHGHEVFCKAAQALNPSLLAAINSDGETPLLAAVASGRVSVAYVLLRCCRDQQLSATILKQDKHRCNALHHAIRCGHRALALELIEAEPALSHAVNQYDESPMFVAVMRNYEEVFDKLLEISDSSHEGAHGYNALHAAVRNGNSSIAAKIMETRPSLAREASNGGNTPMHMATLWDKIDVLGVLLEHDRSLGYVSATNGVPLLVSAAYRGHVGVARELLKHCPDVPLVQTNGSTTCLHRPVKDGRMKFVDFVLGLPQFGRLINMRDSNGDTAIHLAVQKCNPKMVAGLLLHPDIDVTMLDKYGEDAIWKLSGATNHSKTLNWNEVCMLMLKADPQATTDIYNLYKTALDKVTNTTRKDIKSLTQTYTSNTSLVAILIATITFAAAFTLPGGYSTDAGNEGLPIMARNLAFKAFLISDTLAMCSSLAVAFICIIAKWDDLEFLLHYRYFTRKLMWFSYMATTTAFATGLYTILAPHLLWLAIAVCVLTSLLPILTKLLGEWPILRLRFRLGQTFKPELLNMV